MPTLRRISSFGLIACAIALSGASAALAQSTADRVYTTGGGSHGGTIKQFNKNEIVIESRGQTITVPTNQIRRVEFGDEPRDLGLARSRALSGQLEQALEDLAKVNAAEIRLDAVKQDVQYYRAYATAKLALAGGADSTAAGKLLYDFTNANPDSYHYYEAQELLGDLFLVMQRYDFATRAYSQVGQAPFPDYQMRAKTLEAKALRLQEKYQEALSAYQQVAAANYDTNEARQQKMIAQIGQAACLASLGKPQEGLQIVQDIIAKNDPSDAQVFGPAYNALGACHLAAGNTKDALLAYLHTDLMFYGNAEAHAEALYHLASLWNKVNEPNESARARSLLKDRYGGTVWGRKEG